MNRRLLLMSFTLGFLTLGCSDKSIFLSDTSSTTTTNTTGTTSTTGTTTTTTGTTTGTVTDTGATQNTNLQSSNLVAYHAGGASTEDTCLTCHGDMNNADTSLDASVSRPHKLHRESQSMKCVDCHTSIDLTINKSGVKFLRQVNPETCSACHRSGSIQWYQ